MATQHGTELVRAAQGGDLWAQHQLIAAYLPLVYNIVGRALNGHHDVDDVVQETMLRALDGLPALRAPDSFRSWLVAITMNGIRGHWHKQQSRLPIGALDEARDVAHPGADFVDLAVVKLHLSGQRRETAEATRWMEPDDSALLSLWWLECAGELTRYEVAAALELSTQHTAVRVQRMKAQLDTARVVVRALSENPLCPTLRSELGTWDGRPSALWRKRIARHARGCAHCAGLWSNLVPAEGLLAGLLLVPPSAMLLAAVRDGAAFGLAATTTATTAYSAQPYGSDPLYGSPAPYEATGAYEATGTYGTQGPYDTPGVHDTAGLYDAQGGYATQGPYETQGLYETQGFQDTQGLYETQGFQDTQGLYETQGFYETPGAHETTAPYGIPSPSPYEATAPYGIPAQRAPYEATRPYDPAPQYGTGGGYEAAAPYDPAPYGQYEAYRPADGREPFESAAGHEGPGAQEAFTPYATQSTVTPVGAAGRGSRGARRRQEQERRRGRRRAVVAAGMAVVAVTGGSFYLSGGPDGDGEALDVNRAAAPGPDLPFGQQPTALLATPSPSASTSASASASASPSARPSRTAKATPPKTAAPRTSSPAPKPTKTADSGSDTGSKSGSGSDSTADQVISLVNAERAKAGCSPLTANSQLTRAAQAHSDDMAARDFFDHTNPDGKGPGDRVTATGYPWSTYGENIAMGQSSAEQVMESWMNSPGHRANILNCSFKEIGIGIHDEGGPYWTQVFGAR
ncbi:sigma-70 family RNA polymerase sigma factor [Streptomyces sp. NPDC059442]|uniref:sigma-70 family RNA polymerase sigma factor n=1 Tax=Streptomyces sp. NPDC059442 TaxID=3346830 RepID=UPI0036A771AC